MDIKNVIKDYLSRADWRVKENANTGYSFSGLSLRVSEDAFEEYMLTNVFSEEIKDAHQNCFIKLHDVGYPTVYCAGHDLRKLLTEGLNGVPGKINTSPPQHLNSVINIMVNYFGIMQMEAAGAQAFSNIDTLLSPYVKNDGLTYHEVKQALQNFVYHLNIANRWGSQAPFTNITIDVTCPDMFKKDKPIIGKNVADFTYADCQKEMDMINKAIFEIMMGGDATGQPFTFPIITVNLTKNFDWDSEISQLIFKATGKYGTPYFQNFLNSDLDPTDVYSMCMPGTTEIIYINENGNISKNELRHLVNNGLEGHNYKILVNNKFVPVKSYIKNKYNNYMYEVTLKNGITQRFTKEHQCFINNETFKSAEKLTTNDYFLLNKKTYTGNLGSYDNGKFVGLYMGDGWNTNGVTHFVFGKHETELTKFVKKYAEEHFAAKVSIYEHDNYTNIDIFDQSIQIWLKQYINGDNCYNKRITYNTYNMTNEFRKGLIMGMIQSDGYVKDNDIRIHIINKQLLQDIQSICYTIGQDTRLYTKHNSTGEKKKLSYELQFKEGSINYLITGNKYEDTKYFKCQIKEIKKIKFSGDVYDFEMYSNDHIFSLKSGIITGNCCRLQIDKKELQKHTGGLFGAGAATGSIQVITLNLPRLAYEAKGNKERYYELLKIYANIAKVAHEIKRVFIEDQMKKGLYPYFKRYLGTFKNHFSTIGVVGGNEACLNLINKDIKSPEGKELMLETLKFLRKLLLEFQEETGNLYNLEATPAESTAFKLAKHDRECCPGIITSGTEDAPYYTNCVSEDTECLTKYGWKHYKELKVGDKILTLNIDTKELEYNEILKMNVSYLDGEMYNIKSLRQDQLVTENHKVLYDSDRKKTYKFATPDKLPKSVLIIPQAGKYEGKSKEYSDDFVKLIGWIVTEGHFHKTDAGIRITQAEWCNKVKFDEIEQILKNLKYKYSISGDKKRGRSIFLISAKNGHNIRKYIDKKEIPRWCLNNLSQKQMNILLDTMMKGDGSISKTSKYYCTGDIKLAHQFQELCLKTDKRAIIKDYRHQTNCYNIVPSDYRHTEISSKNVKKVKYKGNIWCPTVENRTWIAKRNNIPFITGNSTHVHPQGETDIIEAIKHQDDLQILYNSGTVLHFYLGEEIKEWKTCRDLVKRIAENSHMPYFSITPTFSVCPICGYLSGEHAYCPNNHTKEELEHYGVEVKK